MGSVTHGQWILYYTLVLQLTPRPYCTHTRHSLCHQDGHGLILIPPQYISKIAQMHLTVCDIARDVTNSKNSSVDLDSSQRHTYRCHSHHRIKMWLGILNIDHCLIDQCICILSSVCAHCITMLSRKSTWKYGKAICPFQQWISTADPKGWDANKYFPSSSPTWSSGWIPPDADAEECG